MWITYFQSITNEQKVQHIEACLTPDTNLNTKNQTYILSLYYLSKCLSKLKQFKLAIIPLSQIRKLYPEKKVSPSNMPLVYYQSAKCCLRLNQIQTCHVYIECSVQLSAKLLKEKGFYFKDKKTSEYFLIRQLLLYLISMILNANMKHFQVTLIQTKELLVTCEENKTEFPISKKVLSIFIHYCELLSQMKQKDQEKFLDCQDIQLIIYSIQDDEMLNPTKSSVKYSNCVEIQRLGIQDEIFSASKPTNLPQKMYDFISSKFNKARSRSSSNLSKSISGLRESSQSTDISRQSMVNSQISNTTAIKYSQLIHMIILLIGQSGNLYNGMNDNKFFMHVRDQLLEILTNIDVALYQKLSGIIQNKKITPRHYFDLLFQAYVSDHFSDNQVTIDLLKQLHSEFLVSLLKHDQFACRLDEGCINSLFFKMMGNQYYYLEQLPNATENFLKSLRHDSNDPEIHYKLGIIYKNQSSYVQSIKHLKLSYSLSDIYKRPSLFMIIQIVEISNDNVTQWNIKTLNQIINQLLQENLNQYVDEKCNFENLQKNKLEMSFRQSMLLNSIQMPPPMIKIQSQPPPEGQSIIQSQIVESLIVDDKINYEGQFVEMSTYLVTSNTPEPKFEFVESQVIDFINEHQTLCESDSPLILTNRKDLQTLNKILNQDFSKFPRILELLDEFNNINNSDFLYQMESSVFMKKRVFIKDINRTQRSLIQQITLNGKSQICKTIPFNYNVDDIHNNYDISVTLENILEEITTNYNLMCSDVPRFLKIDYFGYEMTQIKNEKHWKFFLLSPFIELGNLNQIIAKKTITLTDQDKVQIMLGVCEGIEFMHQNDIVHLDLKPQNILLQSKTEPLLIDFGISRKQVNESRKTSQFNTITYKYSSRELAQGILSKTVNQFKFILKKADIYSLGCILYYLFTERSPWPSIDRGDFTVFFNSEFAVSKIINKKNMQDAHQQEIEAIPFRHIREAIILCTQTEKLNRPTIKELKQMILQQT